MLIDIAFEALNSLLSGAVEKSIASMSKLKPIKKILVRTAISKCAAEVWESLDAFLVSENILEQKRALLLDACIRELKPYFEDPRKFLQASLDGQKLFDQIYQSAPFPKEICDEQLDHMYSMAFPVLASLLCHAPVLVAQWEEDTWSETFNRFDQLSDKLARLNSELTEVHNATKKESDSLFTRICQHAIRNLTIRVEVTGLYGDRAPFQAKEEMFVLPSIRHYPIGELDLDPLAASAVADHFFYFLDEGGRSIVKGPPGAGKSTWSRWLQVQSMREKGKLGLYLRLREWSSRKLPTIEEMVKALIGANMSTEIDGKIIARWVANGRIVLIVDGFDEVSPSERDSVLSQIVDHAYYINSGAVILTSRPLTTDQLDDVSGNWNLWRILPFDRSQIVDYIQRWYLNAPLKEGASTKINAERLYGQLTKDSSVSHLTTNPLMLATLLMVHHNDGDLPKGRARLYDRYIGGMLGLWDQKQEVNADSCKLERDQKRRILTAIAIHFHINNVDEIGDVDAESVTLQAIELHGFDTKVQLVLHSLRERSGLLIGPGSYSFSHKSIGEYLVAQAICDGDRLVQDEKLDRHRLYRERRDDRWLNVLFFWAGLAPLGEAKSFVDDLLGEDDYSDLGLAFGILWDQVDRFDTGWLCERLTSAMNKWDTIGREERGAVFSNGGYCSLEIKDDRGRETAEVLPFRSVVEGNHWDALEGLAGRSRLRGADAAILNSIKRRSVFNAFWYSLKFNIENVPHLIMLYKEAAKRWEGSYVVSVAASDLGWGMGGFRKIGFPEGFQVLRSTFELSESESIVWAMTGLAFHGVATHISRPGEIGFTVDWMIDSLKFLLAMPLTDSDLALTGGWKNFSYRGDDLLEALQKGLSRCGGSGQVRLDEIYKLSDELKKLAARRASLSDYRQYLKRRKAQRKNESP